MTARLAAVWVHPIKSCRPVAQTSARVTARGLEHDRRYMVCDGDLRFVTLRTLPALSHITVRIERDGYAVALPDGTTLTLPFAPEGPWVQTAVWGDAVRAREDVGAGAALSAWAGVPLRLVGMTDAEPRIGASAGVPVSFADAYPLMAVSQATLDDLSARVGREMAVERFRPSVLWDGMDAYAEDAVDRVTIGGVTLRAASLCSRCVATTIDPVTLETGPEPLATLARYRRGASGSVYLGVNLIPEAEGTIAVGDPVVVTSRVREGA